MLWFARHWRVDWLRIHSAKGDVTTHKIEHNGEERYRSGRLLSPTLIEKGRLVSEWVSEWFAVMVHSTFYPNIPFSQKGSNTAGRSGGALQCKVPQRGIGAQPGPLTHLDIFWTRKTCLVTFRFFLYGPKRGNWSQSSYLAFLGRGGGASVPLAHACWRPCLNMPIYTVSQKNCAFCLCQNFVKFLLTLISFGRLMAKWLKLYGM